MVSIYGIIFSFKKIHFAVLTVLLSCSTHPLSALGAIANVSVVNYQFIPDTTNINAGDTVIWTWGTDSFQHNVVSLSTPYAWLFPNTGGTPDNQNNFNLKSDPFVFTNTFTTAGSFPYQCTAHGFIGMAGTIHVAAGNVPPSVTITNPVSGTVLAAPANVTIQASATDDGTVTNVQFLIGTTVLTNQSVAPFFAVSNNLAAGSYTLSAIASDNLGVTATNTISLGVVTPLALTISAPQLLAASFQFNYAVNTGLTYIVQRSTSLAAPNWVSIVTNTASSNPVVFVDTQATNTPGFYRVGRLPNP